jgi:uncharacterized protein
MGDIPYAFAGLLVGMLVGATGIGGGALMTPLLILLFGVNPVVAVGTDLLFAALTKVAAVAVLGRRGSVDWAVARRLLAGSLPAAALATLFVFRLDPSAGGAAHLVKLAVGAMLVVTAVLLFAAPRGGYRNPSLPDPEARRGRALVAGTLLVGAVIGVVVTATSVGAGALGTLVLLALYRGYWTPRRLVGTDLAHAIPLAVVAGAGYWVAGSLDFRLLGWLLAGSVPGAVVGALFASKAPVAALRLLIAGALLLSGLKLLATA